MKSTKKSLVKKDAAEVAPKKIVKKVIAKPAAKTTTKLPKVADLKELRTVVAQEKIQTAEGWKRAMLLERKTAGAAKKQK
jgi:hypothetical protein